MIYIVEGSNRVGKTTYIKEKIKENDIYIRNRYVLDYMIDHKHDSLISSLSMLDFIEELSKKDFDVYLDRFHISEIVYGRLFRKYDNYEMSYIIDDKLSKIENLKLIFITSDYYHLDKIKEKEKLNEYLSIQNMFRKEIIKSKIKDKEIINNNY